MSTKVDFKGLSALDYTKFVPANMEEGEFAFVTNDPTDIFGGILIPGPKGDKGDKGDIGAPGVTMAQIEAAIQEAIMATWRTEIGGV